jgi:2-iminobutanoate/2-iminopropanoate deaminase
MTKREVLTSTVPATGLPYAQAIRAGGFVFVAGQVALDPATGQAMAGDVTAQTERVIENIRGILENAGTSLANAVENLCFLADVRRDFAAFNAVYGRYFDTNGPTRTTVQAVLPREGLLVEIRCLAVMPEA